MSGTVPVKWVARSAAELLEECLVGAADGLQLGASFGEQRIGDVDESARFMRLAIQSKLPTMTARRGSVRDPPVPDTPAAIAGRQDVHRLVLLAGDRA